MATVIMIVNYDHNVIATVNYDPKTFIVQATGLPNIILKCPRCQCNTTLCLHHFIKIS